MERRRRKRTRGVEEAGEEAEDEAATADEDKVRKLFVERASRGVLLGPGDVKRECRSRGWKVPSPQFLAGLRSERYALAKHSRWTKPKHYMKGTFEDVGLVMLDVAEMTPNLAVFNKGAKYFMAAKDVVFGAGDCIPLSNKKRSSWERAISHLLDKPEADRRIKVIKTFISDEDVAISSAAFRKKILDERGIKWIIRRGRSKAYAAERWIRFLKDRFGQAMELNRDDPAKRNRWVELVDPVVDDYNSKPVPGTTTPRAEVDGSNYLELLGEMRKTAGHPRENVFLYAGQSYSPELASRIFKFGVGDTVLLSRSASYGPGSTSPGGVFLKRSLKGSFANARHVVTGRFTRTSGQGHVLPTYTLSKLPGSVFYQSELVRCPPEDESVEAPRAPDPTSPGPATAAQTGPRRSARIAAVAAR
jgi:hypothetical protein